MLYKHKLHSNKMAFAQLMQRNTRTSFMVVSLNNVQSSFMKFSSYLKPKERINEPISQKRARLLYQSRKRGMLENGLLLSTFADKHLNSLTSELIDQYDKVINLPSNDWDLYYWLTEKEPTPPEYNNEIMNMLKKHVKNEQKESRIRQPDLENTSL